MPLFGAGGSGYGLTVPADTLGGWDAFCVGRRFAWRLSRLSRRLRMLRSVASLRAVGRAEDYTAAARLGNRLPGVRNEVDTVLIDGKIVMRDPQRSAHLPERPKPTKTRSLLKSRLCNPW